jgi:hypothetical protein
VLAYRQAETTHEILEGEFAIGDDGREINRGDRPDTLSA